MAIVLEPRVGFMPMTMRPGPRVKKWLQDKDITVTAGMDQAIESVTERCAEELVEIADRGNAYQHQEQIQMCNVWLHDAIVAHLEFGDIPKYHGTSWMREVGLRLPDGDWLSLISSVPSFIAEGWNACVENETTRGICQHAVLPFVLKIAEELTINPWQAIGGQIYQTPTEVGSLHRWDRNRKLGAAAGFYNLATIYRIHKLLGDIAFTGDSIWGEFNDRKRDTPRRVASQDKYIWQEQESYMPYNRRTGQWYPSQRRYGTYRRPYRRYNRYNRGWAPRRRRSYRTW